MDTTASLTETIDGDDARFSIKEKWQGAVTQGSGFVAIPMALLRLQAKYDLAATELLVLINLLAHWWDPGRAVYPRSTTIAKRMGVDTRTIQRATQKLERKGLLSRSKRADGRRVFTFDNLVQKLAKDVTLAYAVHAEETHGA
jgi:predicted transcriptional regulator